ncbi:MAG: hypothetical protein ACREK6_16085 [Candidatus Rokuibacteriota bacterium]
MRSLLARVGHVLKQPLSRVQAVIGIAAGLISISGAVYSSMHASPPPLAQGEVVAIVTQARSLKPVAGAIVEVYTPRDALVTTLSAREEGRVRHALREGDYKLRVFHPRYGVEIRQVQVQARHVSEIRIGLLPRVLAPASPKVAAAPGPKAAAADEGIVKQFFRKLGFD